MIAVVCTSMCSVNFLSIICKLPLDNTWSQAVYQSITSSARSLTSCLTSLTGICCTICTRACIAFLLANQRITSFCLLWNYKLENAKSVNFYKMSLLSVTVLVSFKAETLSLCIFISHFTNLFQRH